ncbi:hypothetical protein K466DRAFT_606168 [Polyporus arcularius HHB13444]|uniref:Uncharacterized protein n=1 Tax=Polyporus arcularius HHB13444 TaxID=1314778 RepID=A0A5C3NRM9_9APHY|nr:hypothetical protein K466DRAFT_606168 [Polyporus arcularius HHB13444]
MDAKIDGKRLPGYPGPDEDWPIHTITGEPCLRFDWTKTNKDKVNLEGIEKVMKWVLASGATEVKHAATGLAHILTGDLRKRCFIKFNYMRTQWRTFNKKKGKDLGAGRTGDGAQGAGPGGAGEGGAPNGDGEQMEEEEQDEGKSRGVLRVRAEKTAEQRKRKVAGTQWEDAKYAAAFLPNAMSDNEDNAVEPGQPKTYLARAPWYRSKLQQDIFDTLDERADPNPDKAKAMVSRVRGPVKQDIEPPKARRVDTALRVWQVDEQALSDNPHWLTSGRVVANGRLWGDAEDPVHEGPASRRGKGRGGGPPKIRRPEGTADVSEARARFKAATAGVDIDDLFAS